MKSNISPLALAAVFSGFLLTEGEAALKSAKVSDYQGEVTLSKSGGAAQPVKIDSTVTPADVVRTGNKSLAELEFNDNTLTRLGANTVFSYSPQNREFEIQSGTALLQVPPGLGGAKIQTAAVTAAITGTTVMVQKLPSGVVKLMVLEGSMNATLKGSNQMRSINAGQMLVIPPNVSTLPQPIVINVSTILGTSNLVKGFKKGLASEGKIEQTVDKQKKLTKNGGMKSGGVVITTPEDLINLVGNQILTSATFDALTQNAAFVQDNDRVDQPTNPDNPNHPDQPVTGGATIGSGSVITPTINGVAGKVTTASGFVLPAVAGSETDQTVFSIHGPLIFSGELPSLSENSPGSLLVTTSDTTLLPTQTAIRFQDSIDNPKNKFDFAGQTVLTAASGKIVYENSQLDATDTFVYAAGGNVDVQSDSHLTVKAGDSYLYGGNAVHIDDSSIEIIDTTGSANVAVYSGGFLRVNNSTIGGDKAVGNSVSLTSYGNMTLVNSLVGGPGVSAVIAYAHDNSNLSILNSQIMGSSVVLGGRTLTITGSVITSPSITFYTNNFQNGGGNTFSTKPSIQPYTP